MELKKLTLQDGEQIRIVGDLELSVRITRHGDNLKIEGPFNCAETTAILTRSGLKLTKAISESTLSKWGEHELDINKVAMCCDSMKQ